ncbi:MAG: hypothetical protein WDN49_24845 [Acetobacteraceae bacterium]
MLGLIGLGGDRRALGRLLLGSVLVAFVAAPVWLVLQAGEMAGATDLAGALAAAPVALFSTVFGTPCCCGWARWRWAAVLGRGGRTARATALAAAALACVAQGAYGPCCRGRGCLAGAGRRGAHAGGRRLDRRIAAAGAGGGCGGGPALLLFGHGGGGRSSLSRRWCRRRRWWAGCRASWERPMAGWCC